MYLCASARRLSLCLHCVKYAHLVSFTSLCFYFAERALNQSAFVCMCVCLKRERLKENNTFICVFIQVFSCSSGNLPSHGLVHTIRRCVCMELKQGNFNSIPQDTQCSFAEKHTRTLSLLSSQSFKIQNITTYLI